MLVGASVAKLENGYCNIRLLGVTEERCLHGAIVNLPLHTCNRQRELSVLNKTMK